MGKYLVNIEINVFLEHEITAESMEDALHVARNIDSSEVIKLKSAKKSAVHDCEVKNVSMVMSA